MSDSHPAPVHEPPAQPLQPARPVFLVPTPPVETLFPGYTALVPCLGAALIIYAGNAGESLVGRLQKGPETGPPPAGQEPLPLLRGYVDAQDVARAFRLALARPTASGDAFFIAAHDTFEAEPTLRHLERLYGALPEVRKPDVYRQNPHASVYDTSRAREILGWAPSVRWADLVARVGHIG